MNTALMNFSKGLIFLVIALLSQGALADRGFSERDIRGDYTFLFEGSLINTMDGTRAPVSVVGLFSADGRGNVDSVERTLNVGGQIQEQLAAGTYTVSSNGRGTASFEVSTIDASGNVIAITSETFSFVIEKRRRTIQFVNTSFAGPNGEDLGANLVVSGAANSR